MAVTRRSPGLRQKGYPWSGCGCCKGTVWVPTTAKTLGISIPQALLTAAEEVVDQVCLTSVHWRPVFNFPYKTGSLSQTKSHFPKNFPGMFQANSTESACGCPVFGV